MLLRADEVCVRTRSAECWRTRKRDEAVEIAASLPWEARTALRLWVSCATQWRAGLEPFGLDYLAVRFVAETMGVEVDERVLEALRTLEAGQLGIWRDERAEREKVRGPKP